MTKLPEKYKNIQLINNKRIFTLELIGLAIILIIATFMGNTLGKLIATIKNPENTVRNLDNTSFYELPSSLYDINNEKISEFFIYKREIIPFHKLPKKLINTFILIEDQNFYKHPGIDPYSIIRALIHNTKTSIINLKLTLNQGGSTISQQITKLLFTQRKKTFKRKLKELWKTLQIEKRYTKNEIIEKYFNQIYFGHGIYGVAAASKFFLNKNVQNINITEASLLASIPPSPNTYSPFKNLKKAKHKHKITINKLILRKLINKKLAELQYNKIWKNIQTNILNKNYQTALGNRIDKAPYFSEYVRLSLEKILKLELKETVEKNIKSQNLYIPQEKINEIINNKIRQLLFTGGFKIYTSLNLKTQKLAQKLIKQRLKIQDNIFQKENKIIYAKIRKQYSKLFQFIGSNMFINTTLPLHSANTSFNFQKIQKQKLLLKNIDNKAKLLLFIAKTFSINSINKIIAKHNEIISNEELDMKTQAALIAIEPKTGYIKAMLGGRKFSPKNRLNRVFSKRQPGSAFKSLVYGAALNSKKYHPNTIIEDKPIKIQDQNNTWAPQNYNKTFIGPVSLRKALSLSINTVAVRIVKKLSPKYIINFSAPILGAKKENLRENISLALGTSEITPMQMCHAMAVYANGGTDIEPIAILSIHDRHGNLIKNFTEKHKLKIKKRLISKKLAQTITSMLNDVINKGTGKAARTIGGLTIPAAGKTGTSQQSKDVWFAGSTPQLASVVWIGFDENLSLGKKQFGGNVVAPLWGQFMKETLENNYNKK